MQQEAKEVLSLLEYVREKAKDIKGFWAFTLVRRVLSDLNDPNFR